jgi:hypothetical protein
VYSSPKGFKASKTTFCASSTVYLLFTEISSIDLSQIFGDLPNFVL